MSTLRYNDFEFNINQEVYESALKSGMDPLIAQHFGTMFTRFPLFQIREYLKNYDEDFTTNFDFYQACNFRINRFKPPPIRSDETNNIGWRVEFRSAELQFTDFENAAICALVILLTRAVIDLSLDFLIPITKLDQNMHRTLKRNACLTEKFYFRCSDGLNSIGNSNFYFCIFSYKIFI